MTRTWGLGHQKLGLLYNYLIPSLPSVAMDPVKMHVANGKPAGGEGWVWCAYPQRTSDVRRTKVFSRAITRLFSPSHQSLFFTLRRGFGATIGHKLSSTWAFSFFCLILYDLCPGNSDHGGEECRDHPKGIGLTTPQELIACG